MSFVPLRLPTHHLQLPASNSPHIVRSHHSSQLPKLCRLRCVTPTCRRAFSHPINQARTSSSSSIFSYPNHPRSQLLVKRASPGVNYSAYRSFTITFKMSEEKKELPAPLAESLEHSKTQYKQLGASGLRVSVPILGAMSFGDKKWMPWVVEEEEGLEILKGAWDRGLNTWDTANIYSNGESERIIGKAIKKFDIPRHKLVILTKCFATIGEQPDIGPGTYSAEMARSRDYINQGGLSRQAIFTAVNKSLERLGTDYIDLLQIHRFDKSVPIAETMKALHDLVESGKVRYIGASSMWATQFAQMQFTAERHGWTKFVSMQNHYNLLYREEEREMNRFCNETGVGLIPWAPLCRGHLARPPQDFGSTKRSEGEKGRGQQPVHAQTGQGEVDQKIIGRVQELAEKKGWKMSQVALAWINKKISSPIIGFSSVDRIEEAIDIHGKELTEEEEKYLEELYEPKSIMGHF